MENSSLVRSIAVTTSNSPETSITAYVLSQTDKSKLYAATSSGILYLFDWSNGLKLGRWKLAATVWGLVVASKEQAGALLDIVYTREQTKNKWMISAHILRREADASRTESRTILSSPSRITDFKVVNGGRVVVAASEQRLLVGVSEGDFTSSLKDLKYVWREVVTPAHITTLDVRVPSEEFTLDWRISSRTHSQKSSDMVVDVVVGHVHGVVFLHTDIVRDLARQEQAKKGSAGGRRPLRKMHWHRTAVHSVKWSLDGMYCRPSVSAR